MKVTKAQAEANRARIVKAAARLFRTKGLSGASVAEIAAAAGLTPGALYSHFKSRSDLEAEACAYLVREGAEVWRDVADTGRGRPLAALVDFYLARDHIGNAESGCAFAAIGPELARSTQRVRTALTSALPAQIEVLSALVEGSPAERRRRALDLYARLVGAAVVAQAVDDPVLQREILDAVGASIHGRPTAGRKPRSRPAGRTGAGGRAAAS